MRKKLFMLALALGLAITSTPTMTVEARTTGQYTNPLMNGADPTIVRGADGYFYSGFGTDNDIYIKRSETLLGLSTADSHLVYDNPKSGNSDNNKNYYIWGPYIYHIDGTWYIYYSSSTENDFGYGHPSCYVLANDSEDPFEGKWYFPCKNTNVDDFEGNESEKDGLMKTESYGLACGLLTINGELYYTYTKYDYFANEPGHTKFNECPTIVKMENPYTLTGKECTVARPTYAWELHGDNVDEGCAYVEHDGYGYFAHSASSFTNDNYCVGLSVVDLSTDVMDENNWKKSTTPIMSRSDENNSFGPGSPLFVKSPDGTEDWIIYHGGPIGGQTSTDRRVRAQIINWADDGQINLGIPSNPDAVLDAPSGEMKTDVYEAEDATCSSVTKKMFNNTAKASGSGYVKFDQGEGYVEFNVDTAEAGDYILNLRYNNLGEAMTADVTVNGEQTYTASFKKNGVNAVDLDSAKVYNVHLNEGDNTIRIYVAEPTEFALDAMVITKGHMYRAAGEGQVSVDAPATGNYQLLFEGANGNIIKNLNLSKGSNVIENPESKYDRITVCEAITSTYEVTGATADVHVESEGIYDVTFTTNNGTFTLAQKLNKGENTINVLEGTTRLHLSRRTPWHYQAENGQFSGLQNQANHLYYRGTGFVGGFDAVGNSLEMTTNVAYSGTHTLTVRYSGTGAEKSVSLYINGQKVKQLVGEGTADWNDWKEIDTEVYLRAGKNTVELRRDAEDTGVLNIDEIIVDKYSMGEPTATVNKLIAGEVYIIKDKNSDLSADIDGYSPDAGREIHLWYFLGNNNQRWKAVDLGNGYWAFKAAYGSKRFGINENLSAETFPEGSTDEAVQWKLDRDEDGYYKLTNKKYEKVLTVVDGSKTAGALFTVAEDEGLASQRFSIDGGLQTENYEVRELETTQNPADYAAYGNQYELADPKIPEAYDPYKQTEDGKYRRYDGTNCFLENGAKIETNHTGYYGNGFVGGMYNGDATLTFRVNVDVAGEYKLRLNYCNGFGQDQIKTAATYVNGEYVGPTELPSTGGWDDWGMTEFTATLHEGVNKISFKNNAETAGHSGDVNYDFLDVSKYPIVVSADESPYDLSEDGCIKHFELERVTLESGASLATDHHDYSGDGFVGGMYNGSAKIIFNVNVPETETYKMVLRYCNGHGDNVEDKVAAVTVNGEFIKGLELPKTGSWDDWSTVEFELDLAKGTNAIAFVNSSSLTGHAGDVNYDYLDFYLAEPVAEEPSEPEVPEAPETPEQPAQPINPSGQQPTGHSASANRTPSSSTEQYTVPVAAIPDPQVPVTATKAPSILPADTSKPAREDSQVEETEETEEVTEEKTEEIVAETNIPETSLDPDEVPATVSEKKASPLAPIAGGAAIAVVGAGSFVFFRRRRF